MKNGFEIKGTSVEEGLGDSLFSEIFKVTKIAGDTVETDSVPKEITIKKLPFDYMTGDEFSFDLYQNGRIFTQKRTGKTYLLDKEVV